MPVWRPLGVRGGEGSSLLTNRAFFRGKEGCVADLRELVEFLDDYLDVRAVPDYPGAWNGLQVDCRSPIETVCVATDACQATIDEAAREGARTHGFVHDQALDAGISRSRRPCRKLRGRSFMCDY